MPVSLSLSLSLTLSLYLPYTNSLFSLFFSPYPPLFWFLWSSLVSLLPFCYSRCVITAISIAAVVDPSHKPFTQRNARLVQIVLLQKFQPFRDNTNKKNSQQNYKVSLACGILANGCVRISCKHEHIYMIIECIRGNRTIRKVCSVQKYYQLLIMKSRCSLLKLL